MCMYLSSTPNKDKGDRISETLVQMYILQCIYYYCGRQIADEYMRPTFTPSDTGNG